MVQSKSGRVELAFKGRIVAGDAARGLHEAFILPLGTSNGVPFFLDGSRAMNWERSDLNLAWLMKMKKQEKEDAAKSADQGQAKKRKTTTLEKVKPVAVVTHKLEWRDQFFDC